MCSDIYIVALQLWSVLTWSWWMLLREITVWVFSVIIIYLCIFFISHTGDNKIVFRWICFFCDNFLPVRKNNMGIISVSQKCVKLWVLAIYTQFFWRLGTGASSSSCAFIDTLSKQIIWEDMVSGSDASRLDLFCGFDSGFSQVKMEWNKMWRNEMTWEAKIPDLWGSGSGVFHSQTRTINYSFLLDATPGSNYHFFF